MRFGKWLVGRCFDVNRGRFYLSLIRCHEVTLSWALRTQIPIRGVYREGWIPGALVASVRLP